MIDNDDIAAFCRKYSVDSLSSREGQRRYSDSGPPGMLATSGASPYAHTLRHEQVVDVSMPASMFRVLVNMEKRIFEMTDNISRYDYEYKMQGRKWLDRLIDKERKELQLRSQNPALQNAWDKYSMILNLVSDHSV